MVRTIFMVMVCFSLLTIGCDSGNSNTPPVILNIAPSFTSLPTLTATVDVPYSYQVITTDPEGDLVFVTLQSGPTGMSMDASSLITWTPTAADVGSQDVVVAATDGGHSDVLQSFSITVSFPQNTITFSPPSPVTASVGGSAVTVTPSASPTGGTFTTSNANPGTTGGVFSAIDPGTGIFTFSGFTAAGTATIDITYSHPSGTPITVTYQIIVTAGPPAANTLLSCENSFTFIPDSSTINEIMDVVSPSTILITDLNVFLKIPHAFTGDLVISLTSPLGTTIPLTTNNGGGTDDLYAFVIFDDAAGVPIASIAASNGTFSPEGLLSTFNGQVANGLWTLNVTDSAGADIGTLVSWCLEFNGAGIVPPTLTPTLICEIVNNPIADAVGTLPSTTTETMTVAGGPTSIADLNVFIDIEHTFTQDMEIFLTSPGSTQVALTLNNGGSINDLYATVVFEQSAPTPISTITAAGGTLSPFIPQASLTAFNGQDSNGDWTLTVIDDYSADIGVLHSWCLAFDGAVIIPPTRFLGCNAPILAIPDFPAGPPFVATPVSDTIVVSGGPLQIYDLNVTVDLTHTFPKDIEMHLISPLGTDIELTSLNGGTNDDIYSTVTFDDAAADSVVDIGTLVSGTFRPETPLATFNGEFADGSWTLVITDIGNLRTGTLLNWCLAFDGAVPRSFCSDNNLALPAPPGSVDSTIDVPAGLPEIDEVRISVDITYLNATDIDLILTSPSGSILPLYQAPFGPAAVPNMGIIFDDDFPDITGAYSGNSPPSAGGSFVSFGPEGTAGVMSLFDGEDATGSWTLTVVTNYYGGGYGAELNEWCIAFNGDTNSF